MQHLQVYDISLNLHHGILVTQVLFSGEGEHRKGIFMTPREIIDKINSFPVDYVLFAGGEPLNQNQRLINGMCYLLKKKNGKKIFLKTNAVRFNHLLFMNIKHFVLCPKKENFNQDKFNRYIKNASYKGWQMNEREYIDNNKQNQRYYAKFVELEFEIRDIEDLKFFQKVFIGNTDITTQLLKVFLVFKTKDTKTLLYFNEIKLDYNYLFIETGT